MPGHGSEVILDKYAETKLLSAFENFKTAFYEIIQETLKNSLTSQREAERVLANENVILLNKCKNLENEHERFAKHVNEKLDMWGKNFQILKKKYRQLKHVHEKYYKKEKFVSDQEKTTKKVKNDMKNFEKVISMTIEDLNVNKTESSSRMEYETQTGYLNLSMSEKEINVIDSPVVVSQEKAKLILHGNGNLKGCSDESTGERGKVDDGKSSPRKGASYDILKSRRKGNVKYQERSSQGVGDSKCVIDSLMKKESTKQIKRQSRDFDNDAVLEKNVKERRLTSPEHGILLYDTQDQSLVDESRFKNVQDQTFTSRSKTDLAKLQIQQESPEPLGRQGMHSTDADATVWHSKEHADQEDVGVREYDSVGIPYLASTPVMDPCPHKDFDETMWSGPASPSVVSSQVPTPEKIKPSSTLRANGKNRDKPIFKCPTRIVARKLHTDVVDSPCLFKSIQSNKSDNSRDSVDHSRRDDLNLSDDMFNRDTMNNDERHETFGNDEEDEPLKRIKDDDESALESYFKKPIVADTPNIKYKYNAVVRKRAERDKMDGYQCQECAAWYKDDDNEESKKKHLKHVCRHKAISSPPPATPNGFWSLGFPETQEYIDKGYMLDENVSLPHHAKPKQRKDKGT